MINESKFEIFSVPLLANSREQFKYYKFNKDIRVDREFSKRHGVLAVDFMVFKTSVIYSVNQDASIEPVYCGDKLEAGFANLGNRLLIVKPNYKSVSGRQWLCGAKKITIDLTTKV